MRKRVQGSLVLMMLLGAAVCATASQKDGFAGRWVAVSPEKNKGQEIAVTYDAKTLGFTRGPEGTAARATTYQLDGTEQRLARTMRGGEVVEVTRAQLTGGTVVVTIETSYPNKMQTSSKETWAIDAQGRLVIDYSETAPGAPPLVMKMVYERKR